MSDDKVLAELQRFMPNNENVRVGDAVASIRDMEQARRSAMENCETLMQMLRNVHKIATCSERPEDFPGMLKHIADIAKLSL